ncbi:MAG: hypothetical protein ACW99U_18265 [Candidatus Thorarchaeota archaeon]|jgi:hypothetical protein
MPGKVGINRENSKKDVSIPNGTAESSVINMSQYAGGLVITPSAWSSANIGFKVSATISGTYYILRTDAGVPVQISTIKTDGARAYKMPDDVFVCHWVKLWSKNTTAATETDVNQGAARALTVLLKG